MSKLVQKLKGQSSYKLQCEFESVRREYWGHRMWACGYFACSIGNVTDEMVEAIWNIMLMGKIRFILNRIDFQSGYIRLGPGGV